MNIIYFTGSNLLLRRSHVYNILKTSSTLGKIPGNRVDIITTSNKNNSEEKVLNRQNVSGIRIFFGGLSKLNSNNIKFDVFYYRNQNLLFYALYAKFVMKKKIVLEVHRTPKRIWEYPLWYTTFAFTDGLVFITNALARKYRKYEHKSTVVFCNTLDVSFFKRYQSISKSEIINQLGLPQNKKLIVYTGNTKDYSFDELFSGIAKTKNTHFILVGTTDVSKFLSLAKKKNILDRVTILKRVNRNMVPPYMLVADILVVPFVRNEPGAFPVKIYEYMASGNPIVSFSNECIREVLIHNDNAILIDPPNANNWADAITTLLLDGNLANRISIKAKEESYNYTWEKRGEQISNFLKNSVFHGQI